MSSGKDNRLAELMTLLDYDNTELDLTWLMRREHTTDPYILTAKHRMDRGRTKANATGKLIGRRRACVSNEERVEEVYSDRSTASIRLIEDTAIHEDFTGTRFAEDIQALPTPTENCQDVYIKACKLFCVHPATYFHEALRGSICTLRHRQMTSDDIKPIAVALVGNSSVEVIDLSDNDIGPTGAAYLAETLRENIFIKSLNVANNNLGIVGVKYLVDIIIQQDTVVSLSIAEKRPNAQVASRKWAPGVRLRGYPTTHHNGHVIMQRNYADWSMRSGFHLILLNTGCEQMMVCNDLRHRLLVNTRHLQHLDISRNELREAGGEVIGDTLLDNDTMETLDLSWNHLRRDGACFVADGLAENICLKKLNVAWNGFYLDGCRALAKALEINKTLIELDLTCNRISKECMEKLIVGLRRNTTLQILRLGLNPLTSTGAMLLLEFIRDNKSSGINALDLTDQVVEPAFIALLSELKARRELKVIYGQVQGRDKHGDEDDERQLMDENPVIVLMEYGKLMGFRLMDLFAAFDKNGSKTLDRVEIETGLRLVNIPLSDRSIDVLINKLDVDGDGEIDFGELMAAQAEHRKKMSQIYAAQEGDLNFEDTEIGRVRIKLSRLLAKKMSGNPAFRHGVEKMKDMLQQKGGTSKLYEKMSERLSQKMSESLAQHAFADKLQEMRIASLSAHKVTLSDKIKHWKAMNH